MGALVNPFLSILVVDDEVNIRKTLSLCLETEGHKVIAVSNFQDALTEASRKSFDLAFVDLRLGTADGLDLIPALLAQTPWIKIVVITAYASIDTAVEAMRRGATDYIPKPFTPAQVKLAVHKVSEMRTLEQRVASLQGGVIFFLILGPGPAMGQASGQKIPLNPDFPIPGRETPNGTEVNSASVVENANAWNGRIITFTGEAIGDAMARGKMAWIHLF